MQFSQSSISETRLYDQVSEQQDETYCFLSQLSDEAPVAELRSAVIVLSAFIVACAVRATATIPSLSSEENVKTTIRKLQRLQVRLLKNDPFEEMATALSRELQFCRSPEDVRIGSLKKIASLGGIEKAEAQLAEAPKIFSWLASQVAQRRHALETEIPESPPQQMNLHPLKTKRAPGTKSNKAKGT